MRVSKHIAAFAEDVPSWSDPFVRGLSEAIGGPLGEHAVRSTTAGSRPGTRRFWTAARIVLALCCLTLTLHWVQKLPCSDGAWVNLKQYRQFCYTDVLALYSYEKLDQGAVPYLDHPVEYPVLTGAMMGVVGLPIHAYGVSHSEFNQHEAFYHVTALLLLVMAGTCCAVILALRRRRPWDAALFALSPALLVTATVNWDFLAIVLAVLGLYAWAKRHPMAAGVLLGLGTAAKLWPGFLLIPLLFLCLRAGKLFEWTSTTAVAVVTWGAVNLPVALANKTNWAWFFHFNSTRSIDWGTLWYIGEHFPRRNGESGFALFLWLGQHPSSLSMVTYVLFALGWAGIATLVFTAPHRPRLAQVAFLTVAVFLIFNKVWSQQFVLWLIPLAVMARPRWGAFLAWQAAEIGYFLAFYGRLMGASGEEVFPEGVFVLAAILRLVTLAVLCWFVVRDIRRPHLDPVRHTYHDDPDGGVLDGAADVFVLYPRSRPAAAGGGIFRHAAT